MFKFFYKFIFFTLLLPTAPLWAWEVDNYYCRYENLEDVSGALNQEVNRRIQKMLEKIPVPVEKNGDVQRRTSGNSKLRGHTVRSQKWQDSKTVVKIKKSMADNPKASFEEMEKVHRERTREKMPRISKLPVQVRNNRVPKGCHRTPLFFGLRAALASPWSGNIETWAKKQNFSKCKPKKTVYDGMSSKDGIVLSAVGLSPIVRVGSHLVGVDKFSHFMTEGLQYYYEKRLGGTTEDMLYIGISEEEHGYGWASTGVKSYGDLAANYYGFVFWNSILDGDKPYFKCINNNWRQVREFDWRDYVNSSFDESINCSEFVSNRFKNVVEANVKKLQLEKNSLNLKCPIETDKCKLLGESLPDKVIRSSIIHPNCLKVMPKSLQDIDKKKDYDVTT